MDKTVGSPPRVRGKPPCKAGALEICRITPACAGKTEKSHCADSSAKDHPRVCGENIVQRPVSPKQKGSPPRVRGKPLCVRPCGVLMGITPACAGKTLSL